MTTASSLQTPPGNPQFVDVRPDYRCLICHNVLREAVQSICGHRLCESCMWARFDGTKEPVKCPSNEDDCEAQTRADIFPDPHARREVRKLLVYCENAPVCKQIVQWKDLQQHVASCEHKLVDCVYREACSDVPVPVNELQNHQQNECDHRPMPVLPEYELISLASALKYLMDKGIVHQDIKPGNIVQYISDDGRSIYRLTDFGAAKEKEKQFMSLYGTEEYLNPVMYERAVVRQPNPENQQFDSSVDIWSHHVCTGQLPFQLFGGRRNIATMHTITSTKPSGAISGVQETAHGIIKWSKTLPDTCRLPYWPNIKASGQPIADQLVMWRDRDLKKIVEYSAPVTVLKETCNLVNMQVTPDASVKAIKLHHTRHLEAHETLFTQAELDLRFQIIESTSFNGTLLWKLRDLNRRKQEAVSGKTLSLYSRPFYTHRFGFKMCERGIDCNNLWSEEWDKWKNEYEQLGKVLTEKEKIEQEVRLRDFNRPLSELKDKANEEERGISPVRPARVQTSQNRKSAEELKTEMEVPRQQLLVFQEDFERERQDRATAQSMMDDYKKQKEYLKKRVRHIDQKLAAQERQLNPLQGLNLELQGNVSQAVLDDSEDVPGSLQYEDLCSDRKAQTLDICRQKRVDPDYIFEMNGRERRKGTRDKAESECLCAVMTCAYWVLTVVLSCGRSIGTRVASKPVLVLPAAVTHNIETDTQASRYNEKMASLPSEHQEEICEIVTAKSKDSPVSTAEHKTIKCYHSVVRQAESFNDKDVKFTQRGFSNMFNEFLLKPVNKLLAWLLIFVVFQFVQDKTSLLFFCWKKGQTKRSLNNLFVTYKQMLKPSATCDIVLPDGKNRKHLGSLIKDLFQFRNLPANSYLVYPTSLDRYFNNPFVEVHERMKYEWQRFKSFGREYTGQSWTIYLARNGFYSDPIEGPNKVRCFFCGMVYLDRERIGEGQLANIHRTVSPTCAHVTGNDALSGNIPIKMATSSDQTSCDLTLSDQTSSGVPVTATDEVRSADCQTLSTESQFTTTVTGSIPPSSRQQSQISSSPSLPLAAQSLAAPSTHLIQQIISDTNNYSRQETRERSFAQRPSWYQTDPRKLAEAGFYYVGQGDDRVRCFQCGVESVEWTEGDDPWEMHASWSPECPFVVEHRGQSFADRAYATGLQVEIENQESMISEVDHIIEPMTDSRTWRVAEVMVKYGFQRDNVRKAIHQLWNETGRFEVDKDVLSNRLLDMQDAEKVRKSRTGNRASTGRRTSSEGSLIMKRMPSSFKTERTETKQKTVVRGRHQQEQTLPKVSLAWSNEVEDFNSVTEESGCSEGAYGSMVPRGPPTPMSGSQLRDSVGNGPHLGSHDGFPRHPNYADVSVRMVSFSTWPVSTTNQNPIQLAEAGFFYTGSTDFVRCFFCGGGLNNWTKDDNPWIEHAKYSPSCFFLVMNKGGQFIESACKPKDTGKKKRQYLGSLNGDIQHAVSAQNTCVTSQHGLHTTAAHAVLEVGYDTSIVQQAIQLLQHKTGNPNLTAVEILEKVFELEEAAKYDGASVGMNGATSSCMEHQILNVPEARHGDTVTTVAYNNTVVSGVGREFDGSLLSNPANVCSGAVLDREETACTDVEALNGAEARIHVGDTSNNQRAREEQKNEEEESKELTHTAGNPSEETNTESPTNVESETTRSADEPADGAEGGGIEGAGAEAVAALNVETEEAEIEQSQENGTHTSQQTTEKRSKKRNKKKRNAGSRSSGIPEGRQLCTGSEFPAIFTPQAFCDVMLQMAELTQKVETVKTMEESVIQHVQAENEQLREQTKCKICMDKAIKIMFLPCGHLVACEECASRVRECPICRMKITTCQRAFPS